MAEGSVIVASFSRDGQEFCVRGVSVKTWMTLSPIYVLDVIQVRSRARTVNEASERLTELARRRSHRRALPLIAAVEDPPLTLEAIKTTGLNRPA